MIKKYVLTTPEIEKIVVKDLGLSMSDVNIMYNMFVGKMIIELKTKDK